MAGGSTINVIRCVLSNAFIAALESYPGSTINVSGSTLSQNALAVNPAGGTIASDGTNIAVGNTVNGSFNGVPITKF